MLHMRTASCALGLAVSLTTAASALAADPSHPGAPVSVAAEPSLSDAVAGGKPILGVRARFEDVDQAGLWSNSESLTVRTQFGWQTAAWHGLTGLLEFSNNFHADDGHFNVAVPGGVSLNGKTQFPIVNDPNATEVNRAQITWAPNQAFSATVGRQRILIDDQRFIGDVGWRQNEQTFDAARADISAGRFKATYAYVFGVNRIFGGPLNWRSGSHLVNASYTIADPLRLEGFVYDLDFGNSAANSTLTVGGKLSGRVATGKVAFAYDATFANERNQRNNPAKFSLNYWQADLAATLGAFTLKGDYESLQGDGVHGFITPLATTHAFQGWADAFAANGGNKTEVDGIRDANVTLVARPRWRLRYFSKTEALVRYHDFDAELTGAHLADEWDAQLQGAITPKLTAALKFADFQRAASVPAGTVAAPASRTKVWVTFEYRL
jgi:hypothetical protein